MADISEASAAGFARSALPLYNGPYVKIQVKPGNHEYTVSKPLLCRESKYFSAMFTNEFREGQGQTAILEEIDGVVSAQSLEGLLQWIYLGRVKFEFEEAEDEISATVELARFTDMCTVRSLESEIARHIKEILIAGPWIAILSGEINTHHLTTKHIISATFLPRGHAVRQVLAAASVRGYLEDENHRFRQETQDYPTFRADVLQEVRKALNRLKVARSEATVEDPISRKRVELNSR